MNVSKVQAARKQLNSYTFDASNYLENHISTVSIDGPEPEKKLYDLFDKLTKQFTDLSLLVEDDVAQLQTTASHTERILLHEMEYNSEKLLEVGDAVDSVKLSFDMASEGAVRIGGKLSSAERERTHIDKSIELLGYIKLFQETPTEKYNGAVKPTSSTKDLREALPPGLQKKNWGTISEMLHDLKKILFELNTDDIKVAQTNIGRVADRVEMELLNDFEKLLIEIISTKQEDPRKIEQARDLAEWLHLFSQGQSIQKRYIFTVVQHRIPNDTFFQSNSLNFAETPRSTTLSTRLNPAKAAAAAATATNNVTSWFFASKNTNNNNMAQSRHNPNPVDDDFSDNESDGMASGPSTHFPLGRSTHDGQALSLMDHLSGLFSMINTVCQEQFSIIRAVFPAHTIAKVTRMLIQRIFNDPAFGIQARVDAILCPAPPQPPLSLPDYLDALVIVREKLSALYLLLLECCSHPSMRGMGSESACLKKAKAPNPYGRTKKNSNSTRDSHANGHSTNGQDKHSGNNTGNHNTNHNNTGNSSGHNNHLLLSAAGSNLYLDADEEAEEILHSDAEIRDFFDDLIGQVFSAYLSDYFTKESQHVRNQYTELLRNHLDDANLLNKPATQGVLAQVPILRWDRVKTAQQLVQTIGNKVFLNRVFSVTTDTVCRMESIGRDDKKLTHRLKDLFLLQMAFLSDGLFTPWSKACIAALLRQYTNRASTTTLPPSEILALLGVLTYGVGRIKSHFDEVFLRPLSIVPNIVAVCKESRMKVFRELDVIARQIIYAWTLCSVGLVEKTLSSLQSKYDYAPKFESHNARPEATTACDSAVKIISSIVQVIKAHETKLLGLDLVKLFWRPLGQQVVGLIVSHVRRQRITPEGCKYLSRDIKEYSKVLTFVEAPDVIDMMSCLREILVVFTTPAPSVAKLVVEELRYLDSSVLIAFLRARSDFTGREPDHYTVQLSPYYPNVKMDIALPWENRKPLTNSSLAEAAAQGTKWTSTLGPNSLRRTAGPGINPVSALFMTEVARTSTLTPAQLTANGRTVTVDLNRIDEEDDVESIPVRALSVQGDPHANRRTGNFSNISQFLPTRPDDAVTSPGHSPAPQTTVAAKTGSSIARPDLLINGTSNGANGSAGAGAGAAGLGLGGKARPQSSAVKSSAATLLSAGLNSNNAATTSANDKRASVPLGRPPSLVPEKPLGNVAADSTAGPPPKKLLNKMASFFQGK